MSGSSFEVSMDTAAVRSRYQRACAEMDRLAEAQPANAWRWSIPANPERDTDLILTASVTDVPRLMEERDWLATALQQQEAAYAALEQQFLAVSDQYGALIDQVTKALIGGEA